jgi:hypothetical protein
MPNLDHPTTASLYELFNKKFHNPIWIQSTDAFYTWAAGYENDYLKSSKIIELWHAKSSYEQYYKYVELASNTLESLIHALNEMTDKYLSTMNPQMYSIISVRDVQIENGIIILSVEPGTLASIRELFKLEKLYEDIASALVDETQKKSKLREIFMVLTDVYLKLQKLKLDLLDVESFDYEIFHDEKHRFCMNGLSVIVEGYHRFDAQFIDYPALSKILFQQRHNFNLFTALELVEFLSDRYTLILSLFYRVIDKHFKSEDEINNFMSSFRDHKIYSCILKKEMIATLAIGMLNLLKVSTAEKIIDSNTIKNTGKFIGSLHYAKALLSSVYEATLRHPEAQLAMPEIDIVKLLPDFFNLPAFVHAYNATQMLVEKTLAQEQLYLDLVSAAMSALSFINEACHNKIELNEVNKVVVLIAQEQCRGFDLDLTIGPLGYRLQGGTNIGSFHRLRVFDKYVSGVKFASILNAARWYARPDTQLQPEGLILTMNQLIDLIQFIKQKCVHEAAVKKIFVTEQEYRIGLLRDCLENSPLNGTFKNNFILDKAREMENKSFSKAKMFYEQTTNFLKGFSLVLAAVYPQAEKQPKANIMSDVQGSLKSTFNNLPKSEFINIEMLSIYIKLMFLGTDETLYFKGELTRYCSHLINAFTNCTEERRLRAEMDRKNLLYHTLADYRKTGEYKRPSESVPASQVQTLDTAEKLIPEAKSRITPSDKPSPAVGLLQVLAKLAGKPEISKAKEKSQEKTEAKPKRNFKILYKKAKQPLNKLKKRIEQFHVNYEEIEKESKSKDDKTGESTVYYPEFLARLTMLEAEAADLQTSLPTLDEFSQACGLLSDIVLQRIDRLKNQIDVIGEELIAVSISKPKTVITQTVLKQESSDFYLKNNESFKDLKQQYEKASKTLRALDAAGKESQVRYPDYENKLAELKTVIEELNNSFMSKDVFDVIVPSTRNELITKLARCAAALHEFSDQMQFTLAKVSKMAPKANFYQKRLDKKAKQGQPKAESKFEQEENKGEEKKAEVSATTPTSRKLLSVKTSFTFVKPKPSASAVPSVKKSYSVEDVTKNTRALLLNQAFRAILSINKLAIDNHTRPLMMHFAMLYNLYSAFEAFSQYKKLGSKSVAEDTKKNLSLLSNSNVTSNILQEESIKNLIQVIKGNLPKEFTVIENPLQFEFRSEDRQKLVAAFSIADERVLTRYMLAEFTLFIDERIAVYNHLSKFFNQETVFSIDKKAKFTHYVATISSILHDDVHAIESSKMSLLDRFVFDIQALRMLLILCIEVGTELAPEDERLNKFVTTARTLLAGSNSLESYAGANENNVGPFIAELLFAVNDFYTPPKVTIAEEKVISREERELEIPELYKTDFILEPELPATELEPLTQSPRQFALTPDPVREQDYLLLICQCLLQISQNLHRKLNYHHVNATNNALLLNMFICFQALNEFYKLKRLPHHDAHAMAKILRSLVMILNGWNNESSKLRDFTNLLHFTLPAALVSRADSWFPDLDENEIQLLLKAFCYADTTKPDEFTHQARLATLHERLLGFFMHLRVLEPKSAALGLFNINLLEIRNLLQTFRLNRCPNPKYFLDFYGVEVRAIKFMLIACAELAPDIKIKEKSLLEFIKLCQVEQKKVLIPQKNLEQSPQETYALIIHLVANINQLIEDSTKRHDKNNGFFAKKKSQFSNNPPYANNRPNTSGFGRTPHHS